MFILRTIIKDNPVCNKIIGKHYSRVLRSHTEKTEFEKAIERFYPKLREDYFDEVIAIVVHNDVDLIYKNQTAYIMTESGQTFEKIN